MPDVCPRCHNAHQFAPLYCQSCARIILTPVSLQLHALLVAISKESTAYNNFGPHGDVSDRNEIVHRAVLRVDLAADRLRALHAEQGVHVLNMLEFGTTLGNALRLAQADDDGLNVAHYVTVAMNSWNELYVIPLPAWDHSSGPRSIYPVIHENHFALDWADKRRVYLSYLHLVTEHTTELPAAYIIPRPCGTCRATTQRRDIVLQRVECWNCARERVLGGVPSGML